MESRIRQTQEELERHLSEHLYFLESSAAAYDKGHSGEVKRLATSLRVLLHDTKRSHSLLKQLGRLAIPFLDTAVPIEAKNTTAQATLVLMLVGKDKSELIPILDEAPAKPHQMTDYGKWWNAPVIVDSKRRMLSRRDIVLYVANQDGGAHVDPALDEVYAELSRENSLGWKSIRAGTTADFEGPEQVSIRQIAHEVLKTLKVNYSTPSVLPEDSLVIGGVSVLPVSENEVKHSSP